MSGKSSGTGAGLGAIAGIALAPLTGGASLALAATAGASLGAGVGSAKDKFVDRPMAKAQRQFQNNLLKPISTPQVAPTPDSATVQAQRANTLTQLQQRSGRASTLLTNQFGG